jgi:hypothetical protein
MVVLVSMVLMGGTACSVPVAAGIAHPVLLFMWRRGPYNLYRLEVQEEK